MAKDNEHNPRNKIDPNGEPGMDPNVTPSERHVAPGDYAHLYHEPSAVSKKPRQEQKLEDKVFIEEAASTLAAAPSDFQHIYHEPSKVNESKPGKTSTEQFEPPAAQPQPRPPMPPQSSRSQQRAQQLQSAPLVQQLPFDLATYLNAVGTGRVTFVDPWTGQRVAKPQRSNFR